MPLFFLVYCYFILTNAVIEREKLSVSSTLGEVVGASLGGIDLVTLHTVQEESSTFKHIHHHSLVLSVCGFIHE